MPCMNASRSALLVALLCISWIAHAQRQPPNPILSDQAIDRILIQSSLTNGQTPFHALLAITGPTPAYSGQVDVLWFAPAQYRLTLSSPTFHQVRIVNGDQVQEQNDGDFYPRWLQTFVEALLDPIPLELFRGIAVTLPEAGSAPSTGMHLQPCIRRDDRPGGITDQMTWGSICFYDERMTLLQSVQTFNRYLEFSDFHSFGKQNIPYTFATSVLDYQPVKGHLDLLERIGAPDPSLIAISAPTPPSAILHTAFVSTLKEETLIDHPPVFNWPTVREGKTDGYMIVYARTDRTGQVRETAKHNSDQPGLEQFGMEQALTLKFHPLLIDGVPQQMEMPLVLHFSTKLADPLPHLSDAETRAHITGCQLPHPKPGQRPYRITVSVNEQGKLTGESYPDANTPDAPHASTVPGLSLFPCKFSPYLVDGKPTYYHGELLLP